jgi:hypothetical protein
MANPSAETVVKIGIAIAHCNKDITLLEIESLFDACGRSLQKR